MLPARACANRGGATGCRPRREPWSVRARLFEMIGLFPRAGQAFSCQHIAPLPNSDRAGKVGYAVAQRRRLYPRSLCCRPRQSSTRDRKSGHEAIVPLGRGIEHADRCPLGAQTLLRPLEESRAGLIAGVRWLMPPPHAIVNCGQPPLFLARTYDNTD